jgi:hypothetical protein
VLLERLISHELQNNYTFFAGQKKAVQAVQKYFFSEIQPFTGMSALPPCFVWLFLNTGGVCFSVMGFRPDAHQCELRYQLGVGQIRFHW